jgi:hypothetical protein
MITLMFTNRLVTLLLAVQKRRSCDFWLSRDIRSLKSGACSRTVPHEGPRGSESHVFVCTSPTANSRNCGPNYGECPGETAHCVRLTQTTVDVMPVVIPTELKGHITYASPQTVVGRSRLPVGSRTPRHPDSGNSCRCIIHVSKYHPH